MNAFAPDDVEPRSEHALCAADVIERARRGMLPSLAYESARDDGAQPELDEADLLRRLREAGL